MKELNNKLDGLSELVTRIDAKILEISTKLEELIAALHDYDDEGYGESSFEAFQDKELEKAAAKYSRLVDIIGQNGNEGSHYVTNEEADEDAATFNDYGMRVVKDNNNSDKHTGVDKKRNNELPDFKHTPPPPPKPKRRYYKPKNK